MRADWAEAALSVYAPKVYGAPFSDLAQEDQAVCLTDLLADLIHFARRSDLDFELALQRAFAHVASEARFPWDEPTD